MVRTNDVFTSLYSFRGPEGEQPVSLVASRAGIFGISRRGGQFDAGTFFQLLPDNTVKMLESFRDAESNPLTLASSDQLFEGLDGRLYFTSYPDDIHRYEPPYQLPPMPPLGISQSSKEIEITWIGNGNDLVLERSATLAAAPDWIEVARSSDTDVHSFKFTGQPVGAAFFRLRRE